jgi:DNA-directed RNA polymerase subunit beta'
MNNTSNKKMYDPHDFDLVRLTLASPEKISEWSFGEVTRPETINYRTQRSEKNGLFDERIFGPDRDYECYCGKYRGIRYKGIICEKCGVEITRSIVRRERMGHIDLATPVSHIWFLRSVPSRIGLVLGMSAQDVEKVIYFAGYIVIKIHEDMKEKFLKDLESEYKSKVKTAQDVKTKDALKELLTTAKNEVDELVPGFVLDEVAFHKYSLKYGSIFEAGIGGEAIYEMLKKIDLKILEKELSKMMDDSGLSDKEKLSKRLSLVRQMIKAKLRPEWMFLTRIPVIPPGLRPMVALEGGRFATSDANDLYRRVINRNNRLLKLKEITAPEVIIRNEKRILQEAVDALIDNSIRHSSSQGAAAIQREKRALKSLSDSLKSKRGLFRQNLLGKRVDYSGRSVIVVGPELKLNECGLPKLMALELFRPFVISQLLKREMAFNIRGANRLIEDGIKEVWEILEEVIQGKYVLLNRAPTLHRLGIQAFKPILIEGNAIQVHPLVCTAFNADFDGDQMAVHVPLSVEAQAEAREIMAADKNILKPGNNDPTVAAKMLDIVLGCFWVTKAIEGAKGENMFFESPEAAIMAQSFDAVDIRAKIKILPPITDKYKEFDGKLFETTVGRILFNNILPAEYAFINKEIDRKKLSSIIDDMIRLYGAENVAPILDSVKKFGFNYATYSGTTWGIDDIMVPAGKSGVVKAANESSDKVTDQFNDGLLTEEERLRKHLEIWQKAKSDIEKLIPQSLDKNGSVYDMVTSGARGSLSQITQMAGMKGLITSVSGQTIEFAITSCAKEGLTPIEYFITTHGSRKGLTDTALNTARAGYLTRKLFVVAQDVVVSEDDCGTKDFVIIKRQSASGMNMPLSKSVRGRILAESIVDASGNVLFEKGHLVSKSDSVTIESLPVDNVKVRSPLSCKTIRGVCAQCYGLDLGKNGLIGLGEAVGTIAAQAIGEPGTQLTMRTFHQGGAASQGGDITSGLPRVEEVFEKRRPKSPAVVASVDGMITAINAIGKDKSIKILPDIEDKGKKKASEIEYVFPARRFVTVKVGDQVRKGDLLTDGSADIEEIFEYGGEEKAKDYVITEVSKIYELQGETVSRKHIEIIVKQMFSRKKVSHAGGTNLTEGMVVDDITLAEENALAKKLNVEIAKAEKMVMGISDTSLSRKSFLSAASFQHTTRVLISNAVRGADDDLTGLMENVIIGRLVPTGSGFEGSPKKKLIDSFTPKIEIAEE